MNLSNSIITENEAETEKAGRELAELLLSDVTLPRIIAFSGDLGVGKTVFARGFTSAIAPNARVKSPTFALVNEYKSRERGMSVYHFDMYRIENADDLYSIGFYEYLEGKNFCLIEWSENIESELPDGVVCVDIKKCGMDFPNRRKITLELKKDKQ